tara:strand:- start:129 stop:545 length:417 start_codon:yes stop_codon:yes gene_type:complete
MRRVVITGIGIVSCIGNDKKSVLDSLLNTKSGIAFSEEHKKYNFRSQVVGAIKNLDIDKHIDRKVKRFMGDGSAYNFIALKEAIEESGLEEKDISNEKTRNCYGIWRSFNKKRLLCCRHHKKIFSKKNGSLYSSQNNG